MSDPTENIRRAQQAEINSNATDREKLEAKQGQVWNTDELSADFEVIGFMAPLIVVVRKADRKEGSLYFQHNPRLYYGFSPHEG
jgi:hypothetical protein